MAAEKCNSSKQICTFITPTLIKNAYLRQCSKEVTFLLSLELYFDWKMITELDLSFLKLTHIDNLSLIINVTHLKMNQNKIKRINNLEKLTKIEHLDLGFNEITRIENLEHLTDLKHLNLPGNQISTLDNLNGNSKLLSLNVANNKISDINEISYVKRSKNLRSLNVANNPLGTDYRPIIIDQFPELEFIDWKKVTDAERPKDRLLNNVSSLPDPKNVKYFNHKRLRDSFLDKTDGEYFVKFLYKEDADGTILSKWDPTVEVAFEEYQEKMTINALELCDTCLKNLAVRDKAILAFETACHKFTTKWVQHCRDKLEEFENIKMIWMEEFIDGDVIDGSLIAPKNPIVSDSFISIFQNKIMILTDYLSYININMSTTIVALIEKVEKVLETEIGMFLDLLTPIFFNMREVENQYSIILSRNVKLKLENHNRIIPDLFIQHFKNGLALKQGVDKTVAYHWDLINKREAKMVEDAKKWLNTVVEDLKNAERQRFRMVSEEICKFRAFESQLSTNN